MFTFIGACIMEIKRQKDVIGLSKGYEKDNLRFLFPSEYFDFFAVIPNPDHAFCFKFLFQTGMRIGEARVIKVEDIDFDHRQFIVKRSEKQTYRKQRYVRFNSQFKAELMQRIKALRLKPSDKFGFKSRVQLNRLIKFYGAKAGIREIRDLKCHTCRKTHETYLVAMGVNDMTISLHMGHTVDTALKYYVSAVLPSDELERVKMIMGDIYNHN